MTTLTDVLKRSTRQIVRRLYIKRIQNDGTYESDWFNVSQYVENWGATAESYGDQVFLGAYEVDSWSINLSNRKRTFNDPDDRDSLFNGFKTRFKTRFKIEISYIDPADELAEISARNWFGIMFSAPVNNDDGSISFSVSNILKVFQLYPAEGIALTDATTATYIDRLVKKEVNGVRLFDQFFEGANDSERYSINPDSYSLITCTNVVVPEGFTVWDKMKQYSLIEDFFPYVDETGNFVWDKKTETTTEKWKFNGGGSFDNDYGINLKFGVNEFTDWDNIWNRVVIYHDSSGNSGKAEDTWTPGDGSTQDIYGERTFEYELIDTNASTSATVAANIQAEYKVAKKIFNIDTKLTPHLKPKDLVQFNYRGELTSATPFTLGVSALGGEDLLTSTSGAISITQLDCKIISATHNLDTLESSFILREV